MGFLDSIVFVPNAQQFFLLKIIIVCASLLFVPYTSMLLGGSLMSVCFNHRGGLLARLAADMMDRLMGNLGVALILSFVPLLGLAIMYTQLMYGSGSYVGEFLFAASFLVLIGILFLARFRSALIFSKFFNPNGASAEAIAYHESNEKVEQLTGFAGLILLFFGCALYVVAISIVLVPAWWTEITNPFKLIFAADFITRMLAFIGGGVGLASAGILFFFFLWADGIEMDDDYRELARNVAGSRGIVGLVVLVVAGLVNMFVIPGAVISYGALAWATIALLPLFVVCHCLYYAMKYNDVKLGGVGFVLCLVAFSGIVMSEHCTRTNALRSHTHALVVAAEAASSAQGGGQH